MMAFSAKEGTGFRMVLDDHLKNRAKTNNSPDHEITSHSFINPPDNSHI
jgi:hypothetical protein